MTERRRRHPAAAGRVMATGISVSATLGIMAVLAANQPQWASTAVAAGGAGATGVAQGGATPTTVVTDVVPRTIVLAPGQTPPAPGAAVDPASTPTAGTADSAPGDSAVAPAGDVVSAPAQGGAVDPGPTTGGGGPAPAPEPVVTQPPVTQPPATQPPTTTAPPPPACTGSFC